MKRYTTAQAIAVLSKPGREGWYAVATDNRWVFNNRLDVVNDIFRHHYRSSVSGRNGPWIRSDKINLTRSDWRIIKPKREKMRRIGTTEALFSLECEIRKLNGTGDDYEIFARRVGK